MLTQPVDLTDEALAEALGGRWGMAAATMEYRAVGFGSHHWDVVDTGGSRWFVTVDELDTRIRWRPEAVDAAFQRLLAALVTARSLRDVGYNFVVAPVRTLDGAPLARTLGRFAVSLYPYVEGESFEWGEFSTPAHRRSVLDLVIGLHTAPGDAARYALADDFVIPHRDDLESTVHPDDTGADAGPYSTLTSSLIIENAEQIQRLLAHYDELVDETRARSKPTVLTHGEPHPGNTIHSSDGWLLVDWDTVLVAPPERDLWSLDPGDGSTLDAYADATGTTPQSSTLDLYRTRWDLADLAVYVSRLRGPHSASADDDQSWEHLRALVSRLAFRAEAM